MSGPSRIIKPQGVPVARVLIEMDRNNQMTATMLNLQTIPPSALHPLVAAQMISTCLPNIIGSMMASPITEVPNASEEKTNGDSTK